MAPQPSKHGRCSRQLVFFLLIALLLSSSTAALAVAAVVPTSYSSHCSSPSPAAPNVSNDAELLSSFHLQPSTGFGHGKGRISCLRDITDDLYFKTRDITFFGMGKGSNHRQQQVFASIWRWMASTMLFCAFTVLWWRLQVTTRRNHEEVPAMSIAMHVVIIFLVCVALDFILKHWVFFLVTFVHMFS